MRNGLSNARLKILVIENDGGIRDLLRFCLERAGYEVAETDNGEGGLQEVHAQNPDLIILDGILPEGDGGEVCRNLKTNPRTQGIPVIMITALAPQTGEGVRLNNGADEYVIKPFDHNQMLEMVLHTLSKTPPKIHEDRHRTPTPRREIIPPN